MLSTVLEHNPVMSIKVLEQNPVMLIEVLEHDLSC